MLQLSSILRKAADKAGVVQPKVEKAAVGSVVAVKRFNVEIGRKIATTSLRGSLRATTFLSRMLKKVQPKSDKDETTEVKAEIVEKAKHAELVPSFVVDGVCVKDDKEVCNIGYACDGCPFNVQK